MTSQISEIAKFCELVLFAVDSYPCHVNYGYDKAKIKIFMHYNFKSICPFDALEETETVKLDFRL